jgi:hypothetical protein
MGEMFEEAGKRGSGDKGKRGNYSEIFRNFEEAVSP